MEVPVKHAARISSWTWIAGGLLLAATGFGCAGVKPMGTAGVGGSGGGGVRPGGQGGAPVRCSGPNGLCTDFPTAPIVEMGASTSTCSSPSGTGPCVTEPEDGTLFPNNWLRPRFSVQGAGGPMKITLHSDKESNDLTVYTAGNNWQMPKDLWTSLASHVQDSPITVTVCGASGGSSTSHFTIAPVPAAGTMVFWAANPAFVNIDPHMCQPPNGNPTTCANIAELRGFEVGSETTATVLQIGDVAQRTTTDSGNPSPVTCIGCHSATPDKSFVTFADSYPWRTATASVAGTGVLPSPSGASFPTVTPGGLAALLQPGWGPFSFSLNKADVNPYWLPGLRIGIGSLGLKDPLGQPDYGNAPDQNDSPNLAWFNLEAPNVRMGNNANWSYASFAPGAGIDSGNALGFIAHNGDICGNVPCGAGMPNWSHDGSTIVYVSTNASQSGRFNRETPTPGDTGDPTTRATAQTTNPFRVPGMTNLYTVPFNGGVGGTASPLNGAASTEREEFYPAFSPNDALVAYTAVPAGQTMYANPNAELYVVSAGGAVSAQRLKANDPPACSPKRSPGINNHWPKWSPDVATAGQNKYYWMIFSSNRADLTPVSTGTKVVQLSQLYLAPLVIDEVGTINSYPAIYLWNQPTNRVNTTPAWETFKLPPIP
jgi:hypothetical protein